MIETERKHREQRVEKFIQRLEGCYYGPEIPLNARCAVAKESVPFETRADGLFKNVEVGDVWGEPWDLAWFQFEGRVPENWRGATVVARLNLGGEVLVFDDDGVPVQSLTSGTVFAPGWVRDRLTLFEPCEGEEEVDLWAEVSACTRMGIDRPKDPHPNHPERYGYHEPRIEDLALAVFDRELWDFYLDCRILHAQMMAQPGESVRRARILHALNEAAAEYRADVNGLQRRKKCLKEVLNDPAAPSDLKTTAVGHAHIDTGWLWPVDETVRKCARTFARQISLMEDYPDYVFGASQAQHYAFVKEHYPALYEKIRQKVEEGRWEPQGGMWVEADCNVIGGESMVRQMLHGKNFFRDEFGVDVENLWLPDVFGYSAALPQILKKSGIDSLVTQKISWSQYNKFPHHTFVWEGIDGSEVVAHFPPEDNYNSTLNPGRLAYARDNFTEKGFLDEFLTLYGLGDGGGGPTEDIVEAGLRQKDLEGSPKVEFGTAQPFLDRLCDEKDRLKRWVGELYLELHRGTLTTQAHNKKMNRAMELRLREIEWIYSCLPAENYPREELDSVWKRVLMNQFHDILPGSSIRRVYQNTRREYEEMWQRTENLVEEAGRQLFEPDPESVTLVNSLSEPYRRPVELPAEWSGCEVLDADGKSLPVQDVDAGPIVCVDVPASAALTLQKGEKSNYKTKDRDAEPLVLENELVRYEFAEDGTLSRAFDRKSGREALPEGESGNKLQLYRDRPVAWDAWDVDIFYEEEFLEQAELTDWERRPGGPAQETLHLEFAIGDSTIEQEVVLAAGSKQLEFRTSVDWREDHRMLRVSFPVAVFAQEASFEIQYGHVRRNTHRNTSWDMAKFESCAHRFVDLSEHDYGVALLNDCKYGHKVLGHVLDLNLLRSPTHPDPDADRGRHEFTYSLLPHTGNLAESCVFAEAAQLNQPVMVYDGMRADNLDVPCRLDGEGVALEVLKRGEKEECHIVRLYEQRGRRSRAALNLRKGISEVIETNLMEDSGEVLDCDGRRLELQFDPFEIRTFKLR